VNRVDPGSWHAGKAAIFAVPAVRKNISNVEQYVMSF